MSASARMVTTCAGLDERVCRLTLELCAPKGANGRRVRRKTMKRHPATHFDFPPPKEGISSHIPALTKLAPQAGKMLLQCPICGIDFLRYACHAKRVAVNYCGRGCAAKGAEVKVETSCVVCGKEMLLTPTEAARITTCSKACSSKRRRSKDHAGRPSGFAAYRKAAASVANRGVCDSCGTQAGPWVVRGIRIELKEGCEPTANTKDAKLFCKHCHLKEIAPLGTEGRKRRALSSNTEGQRAP
jgi:hypothetical protein